MNLLSCIVVGCALIPCWSERGEAQTTTTDTLSFLDLRGVYVVVEPLDAKLEQFGVFADSLRDLLEAKFSSAGIRLLSEDEWQTTLGNPLAFLDVNLAQVSQRMYMYRVQLELRQLVVLARDSTIPVFTPTWKSGQTFGVTRDTRLHTIREYVGAAADRFIKAYEVVNRRRKGGISY